jgi:hypothetical protein
MRFHRAAIIHLNDAEHELYSFDQEWCRFIQLFLKSRNFHSVIEIDTANRQHDH